ncbi:DNA dependent RNA polymerase subunit H like protein [Red seabream iridovirus]|uniref:DNA dependent RNA polymerase subunit H like protein n=3 Tax=Infectious spleen and kidney necrosis virus TaxID=180170 RepID=F1SVV1_RSIV|nr:DNA dependent RNA polymerase subunit H [Pompano iridovirus]QND75809.1 DNA dependent RNA polymerase subunit H like protein [Red seabream iridovirus]QQA03997.1 DNA dependent RNA polymerase subunit H [Large yellow croaker iridovirus]UWH19154.1 DNA dependent RNA polymerase subunit H [Infectious spleen and kidney necrosis virus]WBR81479.1 DNA dependent RNA polymerase subunit H like protein [Spotted knifejaw iridovirus]WDW25935.1 DNA dependent RNA polymerase subunit H [Megalocytivirus FD201807]
MHTAMNLSSLVSARGFDCGLIQQVAVNEWRIPGQLQLFDFAQERLNTTSISHLKSCVTEHNCIVLYTVATHDVLRRSSGPIRADAPCDEARVELLNKAFVRLQDIELRRAVVRDSRRLPKLLATDPCVRFFGFVRGDVVSCDEDSPWHRVYYSVV